MKQIDFYLDFISPYAYLAFETLPQALQGISHTVCYKPVLFASFLKHFGQLGPAEIAPKRDWTYRQVQWHAHRHHIPMDLPAAHPFNPLGLLRLALACSEHGQPNRYLVETIFRHVWRGGEDAADSQRLMDLALHLNPRQPVDSEAVKQQLRRNTDEALAAGVFGVPSFVVDQQLFWGFDALPMLRAYLEGDPWFEGPEWRAVDQLPVGIRRQA